METTRKRRGGAGDNVKMRANGASLENENGSKRSEDSPKNVSNQSTITKDGPKRELTTEKHHTLQAEIAHCSQEPDKKRYPRGPREAKIALRDTKRAYSSLR